MTKADIISLHHALERQKQRFAELERKVIDSKDPIKLEDFVPLRFKVAMAHIVNDIRPTIQALTDTEKEIKDITADAMKERNALIEEIGVAGPQGKFIPESDREKQRLLERKDSQLKEKYKEQFDKQRARSEEYQAQLSDEVDINLYKVSYRHCPSIIDSTVLELLLLAGAIIDEPESELPEENKPKTPLTKAPKKPSAP